MRVLTGHTQQGAHALAMPLLRSEDECRPARAAAGHGELVSLVGLDNLRGLLTTDVRRHASSG